MKICWFSTDFLLKFSILKLQASNVSCLNETKPYDCLRTSFLNKFYFCVKKLESKNHRVGFVNNQVGVVCFFLFTKLGKRRKLALRRLPCSTFDWKGYAAMVQSNLAESFSFQKKNLEVRCCGFGEANLTTISSLFTRQSHVRATARHLTFPFSVKHWQFHKTHFMSTFQFSHLFYYQHKSYTFELKFPFLFLRHSIC